MRIGLLSDTHNHLDPRVFNHFKDCEEIWHAGDIGSMALINELAAFKTVRAVYGNIDDKEIRSVYPEDLWFRLEGLTFWITHIGGYPPKYNKRIKTILKSRVPNVMICGHSHILKIMRDPALNNMLYINPGASGLQGFHKKKTLMKFSIEKGNISQMQVIELGKRA